MPLTNPSTSWTTPSSPSDVTIKFDQHHPHLILFLITICLLTPTTMCSSIRSLWLSPSSVPSESPIINPSSLSNLITNENLFNSLKHLKSSTPMSTSSSADNMLQQLETAIQDENSVNSNNLLIARNNDNLNFQSVTNSDDNGNDNFLTSQQQKPSIESDLNSGNDLLTLRMLMISKKIGQEGRGKRGDDDDNDQNEDGDMMAEDRRSDFRVKKALSLFAHWKPSASKQHLDDGYSSELISAVSRGNGRPKGHSLRWGK